MASVRSRIFLWIVATSAALAAQPAHLQAANGLTISWTNNLLQVAGPNLPGGSLEILYLEAFCRSGSTRRDWRQTTLPHRTSLLAASADRKRLELLTRVEPDVEVLHEVRASDDAVEFVFRLTN